MVGVSVSLGSQKSSSQQQQEQTQVSGSALTAGNNLSIKASGSDILIAGSQLKAGAIPGLMRRVTCSYSARPIGKKPTVATAAVAVALASVWGQRSERLCQCQQGAGQ